MASTFYISPSSSVPVDPPNQLTITDLPEVLDLLSRHGYSGVTYYILGVYIGLSHATLDVIKRINRGDIESCLHECLTKWLEKADNVQKTKGGSSIYSLVSALRELGENEVADGIDMEIHPACRILARYVSNQSLLSALPQMNTVLHQAKLIQEMVIPHYIQREVLMHEIQEAVCIDHRKLEAFANILCKGTATDDIGYFIMRDYREIYGSDDENVGELKIYLPKSVTSEFEMMRLKLGETCINVESIIMRNPQSSSVRYIKHLLGEYDIALSPQLAQCEDMHDILELVEDNISIDDISLLEYLVNELNIHEAKPIIFEKYKEAIVEIKLKLHQFLEHWLLKASSPLKSVTVVVDKDTSYSVLNDVQRLSSVICKRSSLHVRLNVIRDDGFNKTNDTKIPGTTESVSHSNQRMTQRRDLKDEDQVVLLQKKVESIQKKLEEEKELHEKEKQLIIEKYKEEILQQKREVIQNEERIATLTGQQEEVTGDLKHKTEQNEELRSENELTHKQLEELEKKLKEEIQISSNFMKQKEAALREKEELQIKIDNLQQKLELQQVKDHKEASDMCDYTITQSEQALVDQKKEYKILQENAPKCTYISKDDISQLSVILEPVEDDWYHIGQCLEVKESVLTEIKEMAPVDSRLTHVLETWCHEKDRTITELKESLKGMDRDDILEGKD